MIEATTKALSDYDWKIIPIVNRLTADCCPDQIVVLRAIQTLFPDSKIFTCTCTYGMYDSGVNLCYYHSVRLIELLNITRVAK